MESWSPLLGFENNNVDDNYKLVPWLNWDEWDFVRLSLFSADPISLANALHRVAAWRSRGCLPVAIEVTASFVEIQMKDPHFSLVLLHCNDIGGVWFARGNGSYKGICGMAQLKDPHFSGSLSNGALDSEEMLSMLYTMAIMRLVNGIIEKTRERQKLSIAVAADLIDMPRMLIDIRHEGSHRDLPSLHLLRRASVLALDWLKSYYWDRQKNAIPYQSARSSNVRKEISSRLRELSFNIKLKHSSASCSSRHVGKRATIHGRNKLFSLVACKFKPPKNVGSKKQITKTLKKLARLYSFFSSDVVSVLLEYLLKPSNSTNSMDYPENFKINPSLEIAHDAFDEWKPVITKFSKIEPDLLLSLLKAVLDMIENHKISRDDFGSENFSLSKYDSETHIIGVLSSLFSGLVLILKSLDLPLDESQGDCYIPRTTLIEVVRRCLLVADPENDKLLDSALLMARMAGNSHLNEKIQKLSLLYSKHFEDDTSVSITKEISKEDKYIIKAAQKLEMLKLRKLDCSNGSRLQDENPEAGNIWTVAKSWNSCPIGMLPRAVGISGYLPVLGQGVVHESKKENSEHTQCKKRDASSDTETVDDSSLKRMRMTEVPDIPLPDFTNVVVSTSNGIKGRLLIGGYYQKVGDQESQNILSRLRVLATTKTS